MAFLRHHRVRTGNSKAPQQFHVQLRVSMRFAMIILKHRALQAEHSACPTGSWQCPPPGKSSQVLGRGSGKGEARWVGGSQHVPSDLSRRCSWPLPGIQTQECCVMFAFPRGQSQGAAELWDSSDASSRTRLAAPHLGMEWQQLQPGWAPFAPCMAGTSGIIRK